MLDIQLRTHKKDTLLIIRSKQAADDGTEVKLVALFAGDDVIHTVNLKLRPKKTADHLRDELRHFMRDAVPRDISELLAVIAQIKRERGVLLD